MWFLFFLFCTIWVPFSLCFEQKLISISRKTPNLLRWEGDHASRLDLANQGRPFGQFPMCLSCQQKKKQSTIRKKMATGTFTYNALHTKILKGRIKTQRKIVKSFKLDMSNAVSLGVTAIKPYLSICLVGLVWFERYCGKMYSCHLFSYSGLRILLRFFTRKGKAVRILKEKKRFILKVKREERSLQTS